MKHALFVLCFLLFPLSSFAGLNQGSYDNINGWIEKISRQLAELREQIRVETNFSNLPLNLQKTLICESGAKHEYNNRVIKSQTGDVGISQINLKTHEKRAELMGLNLYDANENMAYALWLYNQDGLYPWVCARKLGLVALR